MTNLFKKFCAIQKELLTTGVTVYVGDMTVLKAEYRIDLSLNYPEKIVVHGYVGSELTPIYIDERNQLMLDSFSKKFMVHENIFGD